jgi:hypothetical protein
MPMTWPGLDEPLELVGPAVGAGLVEGAVLGGDDSGGDGLRQRERAADGEHPVTNLRAVGVAELDGGQGLGCVDFDDGDVGLGVYADDVRRTAVLVLVVGIGGELDVDLVGLIDDVVVGDDVATRIDDEARAEGLALAAALGAVISARPSLAAEVAVEKVLQVALVAVIAPVGAVGN